MGYKGPSFGLNHILDKNDKGDIFEYNIERGKFAKFLGGKFSFGSTLFRCLVNLTSLLALTAIAFGIYIIITNLTSKNYGDHCNKDSECDSSLNLRCQFGVCNCSSTHFYNSTNAFCDKKYSNKVSCKKDYECSDTQVCLKSICDCPTGRFWDTSTSTCEKAVAYGEYCTSDAKCGTGTNMNCKNSVCYCSDSNLYYWNGTFCANVQSYMGDCKTNSTCRSLSNLVCNITELYPNKCTCLPYYYWDSTNQMCYAQKNVNGSCTSTAQCKSDTGLLCTYYGGSFSLCLCAANYYWSDSANSCVKKAKYGESCTTCDDTLLLSCNSANYCVCPGTHFWNGTSCALDVTNGINCENNFDCDSSVGLSCDTTYKKCVCASTHYWKNSMCTLKQINGSYCIRTVECQSQNGLACISNRCSCPTGSFWNINTCTVKYDPNTDCLNSYECRDYNGLTCFTTAIGFTLNTSYSCQCQNDQYWTSSSCAWKKWLYNSACTYDYECQNSKGLICAGSKCICPYTHYWDGSSCTSKKAYLATCSSTDQCQDYLAVQCLNYDGTFKCQCNKMNYWDDRTNQGCLFKKTNNTACNATNPACQDYAGLSCIGFICQCTYPYYWLINKCQKPAGINQYCDGTTFRCEPGLVCDLDQNNLQTCQCPSTQHYDGSKCIDFRSYQETCSYWAEPCDYSIGLLCPTTNFNCNCPTTSTTYKCDCQIKNYWNGTHCTARSSHRGVCTQNYMCTSGVSLVCNIDYNQCMCSDINFQYWNGVKCLSCPAGQRTYSPFTSCVAY